MSSKKDKNEQEPQTEEVKAETVETAAEEITDEVKEESKEAKKEKQIIQDKDMKALLAVPPDTQKGNRDQNKRGLSP